MNFQIFVIFHRQTFQECYAKLPREQLDYLTFVAANPDLPKEYPPGVKILREWELPFYDPRYQREGYCENSVLFHLTRNGLLQQYDYVGFCQYDMVLSDLSGVIACLETSPSGVFFQRPLADEALAGYPYCFLQSWRGGTEIATLNAIETEFEKCFGRKVNRHRKYPMWNTYIVPARTFEAIANWAMHVDTVIYPWCVEPPHYTKLGHVAGVFERVFSLGIGELLDPAPCRFVIENRPDLKDSAMRY